MTGVRVRADGVDNTVSSRRSADGAADRGSRSVTRFRKRKPVRGALITTHRWSSLILGLLLVIQSTSGAVLLYHAELFRVSHRSFYQHTDTPPVVSTEQAVDLVRTVDPNFDVGWVGSDGGVIAVGNRDRTAAYSVDPGTGRINEHASITDGALGLLQNLHNCAFGCVRYAGAVPAVNGHAPILDFSWAALILSTVGLLLVLLAVSGAVIWWPSVKRLRHGFRVRTRKGRFARDRDLHNVIGIVSVPFLLMWGITGAAFEFPAVERAWLAMTGGEPVTALPQDSFTPRQAPPGAPTISITEASDLALHQVPGRLAYLMLPTEAANYYRAAIAAADAYSPYENRAFYSGDVFVYINANDPTDTKTVDSSQARPLANSFYDQVFQPAHFGWLVNSWWRLIWLLFGLTPLALAVTGLSTWLFKRATQRRKRAA
ncbi:PepSY-associated TM helix domain-containing protein [Nocardia sp. NPDC023852]|uniref:PepSY-associated TM helix domain-containing protein n=1 Tax=Nocardia sp. NPDC023852 TaxID=3154697 RepID=UPI00340C663A